MNVKRRKASVLVTPVAVHEQWNASVVRGKQLPVQNVTRTVRRAITHVYLGIYLTVIEQARERASFCNISKARTLGLAIGTKMMSPADAYVYVCSH